MAATFLLVLGLALLWMSRSPSGTSSSGVELADGFTVGFPAATGERVGTFQGKPVTTGELQQLADIVSQNQQAWWNDPIHKDELINRWALERFFAAEAHRRGLDKDPKIQAKMAYAARSVLVDALMDQVRQGAMEEATVRQEFEAHRGEFGSPRVRIDALAFASEADAREARRRLEGGEPFSALAAKAVEGPGKEQGGSFPEGPAIDLPDPVQHLARTLTPGALSPPTPHQGRFWVARLISRSGEATFEEAAPAVKLRLGGEAQRQFVKSTKEGLDLQVDAEAFQRFQVK